MNNSGGPLDNETWHTNGWQQSKASKVWFSYPHNCTLANRAVFHSVCQDDCPVAHQNCSLFSYCAWLRNWLLLLIRFDTFIICPVIFSKPLNYVANYKYFILLLFPGHQVNTGIKVPLQRWPGLYLKSLKNVTCCGNFQHTTKSMREFYQNEIIFMDWHFLKVGLTFVLWYH